MVDERCVCSFSLSSSGLLHFACPLKCVTDSVTFFSGLAVLSIPCDLMIVVAPTYAGFPIPLSFITNGPPVIKTPRYSSIYPRSGAAGEGVSSGKCLASSWMTQAFMEYGAP